MNKLSAEEREALRDLSKLDTASTAKLVVELRTLWKQALEREGDLASAVADAMWKATPYGETDGGDTYAYIVPKGTMHRLIGVAQSNGFGVPVAFRADAATVCIAHGRFAPCRKQGDHRTTDNPYWVKSVRDYHGSTIEGLTWEPAWEAGA